METIIWGLGFRVYGAGVKGVGFELGLGGWGLRFYGLEF